MYLEFATLTGALKILWVEGIYYRYQSLQTHRRCQAHEGLKRGSKIQENH